MHENKAFPEVVASAWPISAPFATLHDVALVLLRAVDEGLPAASPARDLALVVLRSAAPDSAPWALAVKVLEGGPLRARHAVELAGGVLDTIAASAFDDTAQGSNP